MKYAIAPRVTGEICLALLIYFLIAPAVPRLWLFAVFAAVILLCGLPAARSDRVIVRLLFCLPAVLPIPFAGRLDALIAMAVCWLYFAIRLASGRFAIRYWVYRREFVVLTVLAAAGSVAAAAGLASLGAIGFGAATVLTGIFSLRVIRLGDEEGKGWHAYSVAELLAPLGAAAGVFALIWIMGAGAFNGLLWLYNHLKSEPEPVEQESTVGTEIWHTQFVRPAMPNGQGQELLDELSDFTESSEAAVEETEEGMPPYVWLIMAGVVLVLVCLLVFLTLRRRKAAAKKAAVDEDDPETESRGKRGKKAAASIRKRIRTAYREYLRYLKDRGQVIRVSDTSQDVLEDSCAEGVSDAERELRQLYLDARYGSGSELRDSDALRAEEIVRIICSAGQNAGK